ncbi:hypothetical protein LOD99_6226 [Oopsacas minuta]|uniref:Transposase n=1 Tax=Oopsacas minuta TaxID=111878 RepID=A0AAV7JM66_9METZ|nr:hypothetical protein LOD99_6226 [Oopsacas minuta]
MMVWVGMTSNGWTPLIFPHGVKINQIINRNTILETVVKPWAKNHFGNRQWTFQQDSAPAHKAKDTNACCRANFPGFISSEEWPPRSPDLNLLDLSIWTILEDKVDLKKYQSIEELKGTLTREWEKIPEDHLRASIDSFIRCLRNCLSAKGDILER